MKYGIALAAAALLASSVGAIAQEATVVASSPALDTVLDAPLPPPRPIVATPAVVTSAPAARRIRPVAAAPASTPRPIFVAAREIEKKPPQIWLYMGYGF